VRCGQEGPTCLAYTGLRQQMMQDSECTANDCSLWLVASVQTAWLCGI